MHMIQWQMLSLSFSWFTLIRDLFYLTAIYGFAEWASGVNDEPVDTPSPVADAKITHADKPATGAAATNEKIAESNEWSALQKAVFFGIIVGCIALYVRWTRTRDSKHRGLGYEKTLA